MQRPASASEGTLAGGRGQCQDFAGGPLSISMPATNKTYICDAHRSPL